MDNEITLPRHLQIFLGAIKPVRSRFCSAREEHIIPSYEPQEFLLYMPKLVEPLQCFAHNLARIVGHGLGDVVQRKDASEVQIFAAVRDFEQSLEALLAGYRLVLAVKVHGEDEQLRSWVEGMYRHTLGEVACWLDELVCALDDPAGTLVKRGLPLEGRVDIPLELKLTAPPQVAQIVAWSDKQRMAGGEKSKGIGFLATLGLIWMGWEIGEQLFGGDED